MRWRQRRTSPGTGRSRPPPGATGWIELVERLSVFPQSGRIVPEQAKPELREVIHADFRVIHLLRGEQIIVLAVRHARRRLKKRDLGAWINDADGEA